MSRPLALSVLFLCCAAAQAQVVSRNPELRGAAELLIPPFPPLLSPLEPGEPDAAVRERNTAATRADYYALRSYHYAMRVYVGKLRAAGRFAEAAEERGRIETYKGYLKETRERLRGYGVAPRHDGLPPLLPLQPPLLRVAKPAGDASPEEQARYRAAAISAAQRNIQGLSEHQESLDDFLAVEDDELEPEARAAVAAKAAANEARLAEERALLHELGGDAVPPPVRAGAVGAKGREALEKAGGAPAAGEPPAR